jgi:2-amino-4-hydroxy-6-hydroxymethyldihydropteridine diphosphokinase
MTPMTEKRTLKLRKQSTIAYIGLGSNLGEREHAIREALRMLDEGAGTEVLSIARVIETDPVGYTDQPRFLNTAAMIGTTLHPRELLSLLLEIERELGRVRGEGPRFGPRTIDLDLLLYGDETLDEPDLQVPHPRMHERRFVLEPLADLDPDALVPGLGRVSQLLAELE